MSAPVGTRPALAVDMHLSDRTQRFLAIMVAILAGFLLLHVLRSFAIASEARGICAGVAGYMAGDLVMTARGRGRKR